MSLRKKRQAVILFDNPRGCCDNRPLVQHEHKEICEYFNKAVGRLPTRRGCY
jgi:hypothetical protein